MEEIIALQNCAEYVDYLTYSLWIKSIVGVVLGIGIAIGGYFMYQSIKND